MLRYAILVLLWTAWCCLHSFLISRPFDRFLKRRLKAGYRYARLVYNLIALASLVPVLAFTWSLRGAPFFTWDGPLRIVQASMLLAALFFFAAGGRRYDFLQFAGIRQMRAQNDCSVLTEDCSLDTQGILGVVRHPWYSGGILLVWANNLDVTALLVNAVITLYFIIGAVLEEWKLVAEFGETYRAYQRNVSMLVPIKWIQRRWFDF
ncbi:MAG: hypothetical protein JEZ11_26410 [Desulfobacterales bacterium]|nr:hypothetical protein [Desulfobacterales bacterium]